MPEGDTIYRIAARIEAALGGREIGRAEAPALRSPLRGRTDAIEGRVLERAEARGKHLLLHLSGEVVLHSHLGMSGRWQVSEDGQIRTGKPWLILRAGPAAAVQTQGRLLRMTSEAKLRRDPALLQLGPDPLGRAFDPAAAAARLLRWEPSETIGAALLDQRLFAGVGNVIRIEACFRAALSPWRRVGELEASEAERVVAETVAVMRESVRTGKRPTQIYGNERVPCPRCGASLERGRQGDDARTTSWCPGCQR